MKNKYGIGFLLCLILIVFGITCAYQLSLNRGKREIQAEKTAEKQKTQDLFCCRRWTGFKRRLLLSEISEWLCSRISE